jgi:hypothetical protein
MPIIKGYNQKDGAYVKFGKSGKKYKYKAGSDRSFIIARNKALKQAAAIEINRTSENK